MARKRNLDHLSVFEPECPINKGYITWLLIVDHCPVPDVLKGTSTSEEKVTLKDPKIHLETKQPNVAVTQLKEKQVVSNVRDSVHSNKRKAEMKNDDDAFFNIVKKNSDDSTVQNATQHQKKSKPTHGDKSEKQVIKDSLEREYTAGSNSGRTKNQERVLTCKAAMRDLTSQGEHIVSQTAKTPEQNILKPSKKTSTSNPVHDSSQNASTNCYAAGKVKDTVPEYSVVNSLRDLNSSVDKSHSTNSSPVYSLNSKTTKKSTADLDTSDTKQNKRSHILSQENHPRDRPSQHNVNSTDSDERCHKGHSLYLNKVNTTPQTSNLNVSHDTTVLSPSPSGTEEEDYIEDMEVDEGLSILANGTSTSEEKVTLKDPKIHLETKQPNVAVTQLKEKQVVSNVRDSVHSNKRKAEMKNDDDAFFNIVKKNSDDSTVQNATQHQKKSKPTHGDKSEKQVIKDSLEREYTAGSNSGRTKNQERVLTCKAAMRDLTSQGEHIVSQTAKTPEQNILKPSKKTSTSNPVHDSSQNASTNCYAALKVKDTVPEYSVVNSLRDLNSSVDKSHSTNSSPVYSLNSKTTKKSTADLDTSDTKQNKRSHILSQENHPRDRPSQHNVNSTDSDERCHKGHSLYLNKVNTTPQTSNLNVSHDTTVLSPSPSGTEEEDYIEDMEVDEGLSILANGTSTSEEKVTLKDPKIHLETKQPNVAVTQLKEKQVVSNVRDSVHSNKRKAEMKNDDDAFFNIVKKNSDDSTVQNATQHQKKSKPTHGDKSEKQVIKDSLEREYTAGSNSGRTKNQEHVLTCKAAMRDLTSQGEHIVSQTAKTPEQNILKPSKKTSTSNPVHDSSQNASTNCYAALKVKDTVPEYSVVNSLRDLNSSVDKSHSTNSSPVYSLNSKTTKKSTADLDTSDTKQNKRSHILSQENHPRDRPSQHNVNSTDSDERCHKGHSLYLNKVNTTPQTSNLNVSHDTTVLSPSPSGTEEEDYIEDMEVDEGLSILANGTSTSEEKVTLKDPKIHLETKQPNVAVTQLKEKQVVSNVRDSVHSNKRKAEMKNDDDAFFNIVKKNSDDSTVQNATQHQKKSKPTHGDKSEKQVIKDSLEREYTAGSNSGRTKNQERVLTCKAAMRDLTSQGEHIVSQTAKTPEQNILKPSKKTSTSNPVHDSSQNASTNCYAAGKVKDTVPEYSVVNSLRDLNSSVDKSHSTNSSPVYSLNSKTTKKSTADLDTSDTKQNKRSHILSQENHPRDRPSQHNVNSTDSDERCHKGHSLYLNKVNTTPQTSNLNVSHDTTAWSPSPSWTEEEHDIEDMEIDEDLAILSNSTGVNKTITQAKSVTQCRDRDSTKDVLAKHVTHAPVVMSTRLNETVTEAKSAKQSAFRDSTKDVLEKQVSHATDVWTQTSLIFQESTRLNETVTEAKSAKQSAFRDSTKDVLEKQVSHATDVWTQTSLIFQEVILVVDTNVCISCLKFLEQIINCGIPGYKRVALAMPWFVMQELDHIKHKKSSVNNSKSVFLKASQAIRFIHSHLREENSQILGQNAVEAAEETAFPLVTNDDRILQCCRQFKQKYPGSHVVLVTKYMNLINKATIMGIRAASNETLLSYLNIPKLQTGGRTTCSTAGTPNTSERPSQNEDNKSQGTKLNDNAETGPKKGETASSIPVRPVSEKENLGLPDNATSLPTATPPATPASSEVSKEHRKMPQTEAENVIVMDKFYAVWKLIHDMKSEIGVLLATGKSDPNYYEAMRYLKGLPPLMLILKDDFSRSVLETILEQLQGFLTEVEAMVKTCP